MKSIKYYIIIYSLADMLYILNLFFIGNLILFYIDVYVALIILFKIIFYDTIKILRNKGDE